MHPALIPYGRENALVRLPDFRREGHSLKGNETGIYFGCGIQRKMHDSMAVSSLGTGYSGSFGQRQAEIRGL